MKKRMMSPEKILIIGAGSWGTALAKLLADKGRQVILWGHRAAHIEQIRREAENRLYLPGIKLDNITFTADINMVKGAAMVVMVVPSHVFRGVFNNLAPLLSKDTYVLSAVKGIENDTLMTMTEVMEDIKKGLPTGVLSGPSFAREVAAGIPTAVTVASADIKQARVFQQTFFTELFRVYTSTDVIGLELGGPLKNIIAIAAGICDGLGYGTNTRAALITRGLAEITRMGVKMGANPLTFSGLAGMGDLVLTCTGDLSRNRQVGLMLGQGKTLTDILAEMKMVAEGVKTTKSAWLLSRKIGVDMPILEQIYQVIYADKPCAEAVHDLLSRDQKEELS
jgi:glycerol-3-phosphate dehydrogenase (NAD(P)+)